MTMPKEVLSVTMEAISFPDVVAKATSYINGRPGFKVKSVSIQNREYESFGTICYKVYIDMETEGVNANGAPRKRSNVL